MLVFGAFTMFIFLNVKYKRNILFAVGTLGLVVYWTFDVVGVD